MIKALRRIHLYLGCFFAPLLTFYVVTGWYQTLNRNRTKTEGEAGDFMSRLTSVHVDQIYPSEKVMAFSPALYRGLVVVMSASLIVTLAIGIVLAFRLNKAKWPVWLSLVLGVVVPLVLLWLGQKR